MSKLPWWFTGRDENAPLLTRVSHVDLPPREIWEGDWTEGGSPLFGTTIHHLWYDARILATTMWGGYGAYDDWEALRDLARLVWGITPILEALADKRNLPAIPLAHLSEVLARWTDAQMPARLHLYFNARQMDEWQSLTSAIHEIEKRTLETREIATPDGNTQHVLGGHSERMRQFPHATFSTTKGRGHASLLHTQIVPGQLLPSKSSGKRLDSEGWINVAMLPEGYEADPKRLVMKQFLLPKPSDVKIAEDLLQAIEEGSQFFRCTVCGRPAIQTREWQTHCTYRCRNTAAQRNKRTKLRERAGTIKDGSVK